MATEQSSPIGPLIGSIIIIILITLGGLYFWANELNRQAQIKSERNAQREAIKNIPQADDINSINADLKKEDLGTLKNQLKTIH